MKRNTSSVTMRSGRPLIIAGQHRFRLLMRAARFLVTVRAALPRYLVGVLTLGLLPIPGPVDEIALVVALTLLWIRHRPLLRVCWRAAQLES